MKKIFVGLFLLILVACAYGQTGFDIRAFSDSTKYGWNNLEDRLNYRNYLEARQKLLHIYEMDAQSIRSNLIKSAVIPGWGQFSTQSDLRGQIILGTELTLIGTALYFYDNSMTYYRKYETASQIDEIERYYKKAQRPYQYSMIFLGLASVVWAYNLFDVIISTEEYNARLWKNITDNMLDQSLYITPNGIEVRF